MSLGGPCRCEWPHCPLLLLLLLSLASPRAGARLLALLPAGIPVGILPPALASLPPLLPCNQQQEDSTQNLLLQAGRPRAWPWAWEGSGEEAGQGEAGRRLEMLPLGSRGSFKASYTHQLLQRTLHYDGGVPRAFSSSIPG